MQGKLPLVVLSQSTMYRKKYEPDLPPVGGQKSNYSEKEGV